MEMLVMNLFANAFCGKRVLVTGHTGFKGSWLSLWLHELGAQVSGISLFPETKFNHWDLLNLKIEDQRLDIRDFGALNNAINKIQPEIVFHLAAQPLVRRSYLAPIETWSTNLMGTVNIIEACRQQQSVRAIVVVTTDKCYENKEWHWGYREIDRLGGHDPYSASKAGAELVVASYRSAFFNQADAPLLATARAGNVIGGGDWSEDRLIPDLVRSVELKKSLEIRSPNATRPWQHVLESLSGYLALGQKLISGKKEYADAWNFGPEPEGNRTVSQVLERLQEKWEGSAWHVTDKQHAHEANQLYLDSSKAKSRIQWQPVWELDVTLAKTAGWYSAWMDEGKILTRQQLQEYAIDAQEARLAWATE